LKTASLYFLVIFLFISALARAQDFIVKGKIVEKRTGLAIPNILVKNKKYSSISDISGNFEISTHQYDTLKVDDVDFNYIEFRIEDNESHFYEIQLNNLKVQRFKLNEQKKIRETLDSIFDKNAANNFYKTSGFEYSTYNKLVVNTDNEEQNYNLLAYIKKFVPRKLLNFEYDPKHHIFMMESFTDKRYLNKVRLKETVHKSKVTGVSRSTLFSFTSDYQFTSVYDKNLFFNFTSYTNPLLKNSYKRYNYFVGDTVWANGTPKVIVKFYPKNKNLFDAIKGSFIWNINEGFVENIYVLPTKETDLHTSLSQQYKKDSATQKFIPTLTTTQIKSLALNYKNIIINVTAKTHLYNFRQNVNLSKKDFNENIYEYKENYDIKYDTLNWEKYQKEAYTHNDSSTFAFYEKIGSIKNLEKVINIGRDIVSGKVGVGKFNLLLNKFINYNKVEWFRLGAGVETNDSFSKKYYLSGYGGYGFEDKKYKYGSLIGYKIDQNLNLWVKASYNKELYEPGRTDLIFDRQQYSSESFRKYQLQLLDEVKKWTISTTLQPVRYTQIGISLSKEHVDPLYKYRFNNNQFVFNFNELTISANYAFGRQFIKYADKQVFFRDKFPVVSFQIINLLNDNRTNYAYTKYDLKISYSFWLLGKGHHNLQANFGYMNGIAPYYKLYNSKGSYSNLYTTINNSFETMTYNEFCSDRYVSLFYSVNFGRLNRVGRFKPSLVISQNMGWGSLQHKRKHADIVFNTMEKGYYETGVTLGDIVRYNLYGVKIGLGISVYRRYGPYKFDDASRNYILKLATSIRI
jgi:hypothetical protein